MEIGDKVKGLLKNQQDILKEYESLLKQINEDDSINENIVLKKRLNESKEQLKKAKDQIQKLGKENASIKISLKEQMLNERNSILSSSRKKAELYFQKQEKGAINRLDALEHAAMERIRHINRIATAELGQEKEAIDAAIELLEQDLQERIKTRREDIKAAYKESLDEMKLAYDKEQREISEEEVAKKRRHNDIEVNIGLNWINKIGIILLLFGVATAMKYTYSAWFNDYMKAISGFILGGVMLGLGEWFNKKEKNLFALGLCGGGIGTLYLAVFSSYFFFQILSLAASMIVSILITIGAIVLSQRYDSRTIAGISLVGGYLPFFSFGLMVGLEGGGIYVAMGYLMILNSFMLVIALERRWIFINYLSFILNIPCLVLLVFAADSVQIGILYSLLTFIMYLGITLAYPIREKIKLQMADLILLAINTIINCAVVYVLFERAGFDDYMGILALIYALGYFALSRMIHKKYAQEQYVEALFSITALTFTILMVPFQFGIQWASMGWLIQAILILFFAKKRQVEKIEIGGWALLALCALGFLFNDLNWGWHLPYFFLRYSLLTFGLAYVFTLYLPEYNLNQMVRHSKKGKMINGFKYLVILNTWIYLLRVCAKGYERYLRPIMPMGYGVFYQTIILAMITMAFAYGVVKIKAIRDKGVVSISTTLLVLANLTCIGLNFNSPGGGVTPTARLVGIVILISYNIIVFLSVSDITLQLIKGRGMSIEYYPLAMVIYLLGVSTTFLSVQLNLANINLIISMIFVATAMGCIVFGFKRGYLFIRRFGLGLSIFATAKLFIVDLSNLTGAGKIVAYFCFGLVLLAISFIYQKLNNTYKEEAKRDEKA